MSKGTMNVMIRYSLERVYPGLSNVINGDVISSMRLVNVDVTLHTKKKNVIMD